MFQIMPRRTLTWVKKRIEQTSFEDQPILPAPEIRYFSRFSAYFGGKSTCGAIPATRGTCSFPSADQLSQPRVSPARTRVISRRCKERNGKTTGIQCKKAPAVQETREQMEQPVLQPSGGQPPEGAL
ncbi:hypothetical protein [Ruegeria atlantica]|uniref:Uncharacterized protein n=1 Tax=Ruegeria atlantica TaxID=81569 RepID=A0ABX1WHB6_9RHOB|nr:hypothetical protein [Ruegeria atlantica]NOD32735.1 hypothetical protein [Ruegeria atlantica]